MKMSDRENGEQQKNHDTKYVCGGPAAEVLFWLFKELFILVTVGFGRVANPSF